MLDPLPSAPRFLVTATGIVHAVYGSALRAEAIAKAATIPLAHVFLVPAKYSARVGMRITPQTDWEVVS